MRVYPRLSNAVRLSRMIAASSLNGCWLWEGNRNKDGYGLTKYDGKTTTAHRASYRVHIGPIPVGLLVLHSCDTPACVNPAHLHLGTQAENRRECVERGRNAPQHGSHNPRAVLTEDQVIRIHRDLNVGRPLKEIAVEFGISCSAVSSIRRGRRWSHVQIEEIR